jgi:hypothetical protein
MTAFRLWFVVGQHSRNVRNQRILCMPPYIGEGQLRGVSCRAPRLADRRELGVKTAARHRVMPECRIPRSALRHCRLKIDPHDHAPWRRPAHLLKASGGEDAAAANVALAPGNLLPRLRDHRIAFESAGAAHPAEIDRSAGKGTPDARAGESPHV